MSRKLFCETLAAGAIIGAGALVASSWQAIQEGAHINKQLYAAGGINATSDPVNAAQYNQLSRESDTALLKSIGAGGSAAALLLGSLALEVNGRRSKSNQPAQPPHVTIASELPRPLLTVVQLPNSRPNTKLIPVVTPRIHVTGRRIVTIVQASR